MDPFCRILETQNSAETSAVLRWMILVVTSILSARLARLAYRPALIAWKIS
jgi:hypothetical protein